MFRSRLFWKLLLTFTALCLAALAGLAWWSLQERHADEARAAVAATGETLELLAVAISATGGDREALQQAVAAAGRATGGGDRLLAMDLTGRVVADSAAADPAAVEDLENRGQRPEVIAAVADAFGVDRRSDGAEPVLHVAKRIDGPTGPMVVRATRRLAGQESMRTARRATHGVVVGLLAAAFAAAAAAVVRLVVRPVLSLNEAADAIAAGDYQQRAFVATNDELGVLARSFNRIGKELGSQLVELREGGQRQATVLGGMLEGVIAVDDGERVLFANTAAGKLFGFIPPQIEGRPLLEVVRHHKLHQSVASGLSSARPQRLEIEWEGPDVRTLLVQVTPLPGDPCPGVVVVLHDTTELRRLESLRQDFVANVSHELKTPLSSIKAYAETLLDGALEDKEHNVKFLRRIEEQADRLNNLIQDLLALARIESDQQPLEIQRVAIGQIIAACLDDYRQQAEAKQIELVSESEEQGVRVNADPEGLRVIFNNLIDNAIKYTPMRGAVTIRWRSDDDAQIRVEVEDTGIGIPVAALPRVFERFYRVDKARSRELGGTGLGLAIVKHLAQAFGGGVSVSSVEGRGSTFSVELPAA